MDPGTPYFESSTSLFVGSPDSLSYQIPSPTCSDLVTPTPRSRPPSGSRSISTPLIPRRLGGSTDQRVSSGVMNLQQGTPKPEHQWTLFGQLMENEGQLPSPSSVPASTSRKRSTTPRRNEHEERFASRSGLTAPPRGNGNPFQDMPVVEGNEPAKSLDGTARLSRRTYSEDNNDHDSGSDSDTGDGSLISPDVSERKASSLINRIPSVPVLYRNILKCSIAYFIASLFTFSPHLSSFISDLISHGPGPHTPFPSGHMVATM